MPNDNKGLDDNVAGTNNDASQDLDNENTNSNLNLQFASIKIPPYWSNRPDLWFLHVETQFRMRNITASNTKYDHVLAALPPETMELVADILLNPPTTNKYDSLKTALLTRSRDSEERRFDALFNKMELGDAKPSELFRQMEALAQGNSLVNTSLLRKLWLNKLPSSLQACIIAVENSHSQEEVFTIADRIHDSTASSKISAVTRNSESHSNTQSLQRMVEDLQAKLSRLESRMSRSTDRNRSNSQQRNHNRNFSRKRSSSNQGSKNRQTTHNRCWYHRKFGTDAKKCIPPCDKANVNGETKN